jgi:hypothetical protein
MEVRGVNVKNLKLWNKAEESFAQTKQVRKISVLFFESRGDFPSFEVSNLSLPRKQKSREHRIFTSMLPKYPQG